jgi:Plant protein of unknown function (DUF639)
VSLDPQEPRSKDANRASIASTPQRRMSFVDVSSETASGAPSTPSQSHQGVHVKGDKVVELEAPFSSSRALVASVLSSRSIEPLEAKQSRSDMKALKKQIAEELAAPLRRHHWDALVSRFFTLLSDHYVSGTVFEALADPKEPVRFRTLLPSSSAVATGGAKDVAVSSQENGLVSASGGSVTTLQAAWVETVEPVVRFEQFEKYVQSMARPLLSPPSAWEYLREALELDPKEVVVKVEEFIEAVVVMTLDEVTLEKKDDGNVAQSSTSVWSAGLLPLPVPPDLVELRELVDPVATSAVGTGNVKGNKQALVQPQLPHSQEGIPVNAVQEPSGRLFGMGRSLRTFAEDHQLSSERAHLASLYDSDATWNSDGEEDEKDAISVRKKVNEGIVSDSATEFFLGDTAGSETVGEKAEKHDLGDIATSTDIIVSATSVEDDFDDTGAINSLLLGDSMEAVTETSSNIAFEDTTEASFAGTLRQSATSKAKEAAAKVLESPVGAWFKRSAVASGLLSPPAQTSESAQTNVAALKSPSGQHSAPDPLEPFRGFPVHANVLASACRDGRASVKLSGTLVLTNRNIYFYSKRAEAIVVPISSIAQGVELCKTSVRTLGMQLGREADNGLFLPKCELRRVPFDPEAEAGGEPAPTPLASLVAIARAFEGQRTDPGRDSGDRISPRASSFEDKDSSSPLPSPGKQPNISVCVLDEDGMEVGGSEVLIEPDRDEVDEVVSNSFSLDKNTLDGTSLDPGSTQPQTNVVGPTSLLMPSFTVTFLFSKMKDLILSRGEERSSGGRRQNMRESIEELLASCRIGAEYNRVLHEFVSMRETEEENAKVSSDTKTKEVAPPLAIPESFYEVHKRKISPTLLHLAKVFLLKSSHLKANVWTFKAVREQLMIPKDELFLFESRLTVFSSLNLIRRRALLKATKKVASKMSICVRFLTGADEKNKKIIQDLMLYDDPTWLFHVSKWISHEKEVKRKRFEAISIFDSKRLKKELDTLLLLLIRPLTLFRNACIYILEWETPLLTFFTYAYLLFIAYYNWFQYFLPVFLFSIMSVLLLYGASSKYAQETVQSWFQKVKDKNSSRANSILQRLRNFRDTLGTNQRRMHKVNEYLRKFVALVQWRDPVRSKIFLVLLLILTILTAAIEIRILITIFVLFQLTKPIRVENWRPGASSGSSQQRGFWTRIRYRFWDGIPTPSMSDLVYQERDYKLRSI